MIFLLRLLSLYFGFVFLVKVCYSWQLRNSTEKGRFISCPQSLTWMLVRTLRTETTWCFVTSSWKLRERSYVKGWLNGNILCGSLLRMRHKLQLKDGSWSLTQGEADVPWRLLKAICQGPQNYDLFGIERLS